MTAEKTKEKMTRRSYVKYVGGAVVVAAVAAAGYGIYESQPPAPVTPTATTAMTTAMTTAPVTYDYKTTFPMIPGATPKERGINGALMYLKAFPDLAGYTITISHVPGVDAQLAQQYWKDFTDATGLKINAVTLDWADILTKYTAEAVEHSGAWDTLWFAPQHDLGTFVEKGVVMDPSAQPGTYYQRYQPEWMGEGPCPTIPAFVTGVEEYKGKVYGTVYDYDVATLNYNNKYFGDPVEQKNFKAKYGYDLAVPQTWKQFNDVGQFFTRPPKMFGTWVYVPPFWARNEYKLRLHSRGVDYFDENMVPQVDTPAAIEALKDMKWALDNIAPPESKTAIYDVAYDFFAKGKVVMMMSWASLKKYCVSQGLGDEIRNALDPGYATSDGRIRHSGHIYQTQMIAFNQYAKHPELAFAAITYFEDPEVSTKVICDPSGVLEPHRVCHFSAPCAQKSYGGSYYTDVMLENLSWLSPDYALNGALEYDDSLDRHVGAALLGTETPEAATKAMHDEWEAITDRIGRDAQIAVYRTFGPPDHKGFGAKLAPLMDPNL